MKSLLYKELKLAKHPTMFIFPLFALMLLIPSYPYYLAFMYTLLAVFYVFMWGRENNDVLFTALLPVRKRDAVKARCIIVIIMELAQILVCVPFALLGAYINPNGNAAGMDASVALFAFVFIMYGIFNIVFLCGFYKTAYKVGVPFLLGGGAAILFVVLMEIALIVFPSFKMFADTSDAYMQLRQIPFLIFAMAVCAALTFAAYIISAKRFERVDL